MLLQTYLKCIDIECDYVVPVLYVNVYMIVVVVTFHICVVKAIFMHAKERNLLNSVCTFAFLSYRVKKIICQVNCRTIKGVYI